MAGIFHDASIGNAVHIVLVRLILLHGEEVHLNQGIICFISSPSQLKKSVDHHEFSGGPDLCWLVLVKHGQLAGYAC